MCTSNRKALISNSILLYFHSSHLRLLPFYFTLSSPLQLFSPRFFFSLLFSSLFLSSLFLSSLFLSSLFLSSLLFSSLLFSFLFFSSHLFSSLLFSSLLFSSLLFSSLFISFLFQFFIFLAVSLPGKEPSLPLELTTFQEDVSLHGIELQNMTIPKRKSYFSQK